MAVNVRFVGSPQAVSFPFADGEEDRLRKDWSAFQSSGDPRGATYTVRASKKDYQVSIQFATIAYMEYDRPVTGRDFGQALRK